MSQKSLSESDYGDDYEDDYEEEEEEEEKKSINTGSLNNSMHSIKIP